MLSALARESLDAGATTVSLLRRDRSEPDTLAVALGALHGAGVRIDWDAYFAGSGARRVELPTYAFQHERYWLEASGAPADAAGLGLAAAGHPLLGAALDLGGSEETVFTGRLSRHTAAWLGGRSVGDTTVLPEAVLVELAVRAGDEAGCGVLDELVVGQALVLPADSGLQLQVRLGAPDAEGRRALTVHGRPEGAELPWTRHAHGTLSALPGPPPPTPARPPVLRSSGRPPGRPRWPTTRCTTGARRPGWRTRPCSGRSPGSGAAATSSSPSCG
ncbi:hypothetical protein [Streptomyces microflavus]|uniref:polyketide synthase dehydratase domain-containing protein n=1 Tax=Streptomyces microflavus TaxID=1919 RepID=UPI003B216492